MKFSSTFKKIFFLSLGLLFFSGVGEFVLNHFYQQESNLGPVPHTWQIPSLHLHSMAGLWFLTIMGYLFAKHIQPGLQGERRKVSGFVLWMVLSFLILTVPILFYAVDEDWKSWTVLLHTYVGLLLPIPLAQHIYSRVRKASR